MRPDTHTHMSIDLLVYDYVRTIADKKRNNPPREIVKKKLEACSLGSLRSLLTTVPLRENKLKLRRFIEIKLTTYEPQASIPLLTDIPL